MIAPMTLEQAVEEARKRGLRWAVQFPQHSVRPWGWYGSGFCPEKDAINWSGGLFCFLGTGAPNPDGWRETLTEITNIRRDANA
jgi:hypothetical protein